ncbi:MAG TPA: glycosyltransferase family A protein [Tepidisphaeraceae bacterium]|jgi:glycosyltransferase involved in cell wall biosynthesis
MGRETVTVIIPAYNSGKFIADALDSALRQTAPPTQVIVINDGSTDDTIARLLPYRDRITVIDQPNQGAAAARNAGLQIATGDFIAFLDADDAWHPKKLEMQLEALHRHPEIQLIATDAFDYPSISEPDISPDAGVEEVPLDRLLVRNYFTASSIMIRSEIVRRVGGFDLSISNVEDFDYWQRVAQLGVVAKLQSPLTGYRQVAGSVSRRPDGVERGLRRILQKLDEQNSWDGRSWLRRKAISHVHYSIAHLHAAAGCQLLSLWKMLQCLAWYPLPYRRSETGVTLGRPKRIIVLLLRLLRLKRPESPLITGGSVANA